MSSTSNTTSSSSFYKVESKQESENETPPRTTTVPPYWKPLKHKTTLITNRTCAQNYSLLILVSSAPGNLQRRNDIRKTWAFESTFKPRWTTVFLVAQSRIQAISNSLLEEDEVYGDLVRADYYDHYWNQTLKIQMGFEWATRYCKFAFLLKTDDDVFVNAAGVLSFLSEPTTPKKQLYTGNHNKKPYVQRAGKWKVTTDEYSETRYPNYCPGFGFVLSHDVVVSFVKAFDFVPYFRLDDVYVGVLSFLSEPTTPEGMLYAGEHRISPPVARDGKWEVTIEEYNDTHYPDFCPGFGYVLSWDVVVSFVKAFDFVPYFRLDDVYVDLLNPLRRARTSGYEKPSQHNPSPSTHPTTYPTTQEQFTLYKMAASEQAPVFVEPKREILTQGDLAKWEKSQAYSDFLGFILTLNDAVKGKTMSGDCHVSEASKKLIAMLETMDTWIDKIPPIDQPQRFGNKAFRTWCNRLEETVDTLMQALLPEKFIGASTELAAYIKDGFGNKTRIDYGTGHEACFVAFLCCLFKLRVLDQSDCVSIVFKVFQRYLELMRRLQLTYMMEPAGSQGVWGLDDFQFLPFIFGSSQLIGHPDIEPKELAQPTVVECHCKDYMFLDCIKFIFKAKTGPFAEHSNVLWGISSVKTWDKVNSGLIKMYKAQVLSKFPVIQHFVFGTLLSIQEAEVFKKPL
ncbi:Serine/threonine-protein phosphatase 2A activator [Desmophyllum pertusum]|uniref:Serine/threonine-protein phosphatase 2A activator n=1 Tax=Desmophyllum pertusum TaxID=174260 RepID=A0A9W9YFZ7_9CNID|nr:Serine/threonine-protein phosphatase 2A activator [Desmophyllum pertusum]